MPMTYEEMKFNKPRRKRTGSYHACENCGTTFYLTPSFAKDSRRGRFCSRDCQKIFCRVNKICPNCNKEFSVPRGIADRYTYCCWDCRKHTQKEYICKRCGKPFLSHETRWTPKYCSENCRRPPVIIECKNCGKSFRKIPSDADRQFCSFSCYRRHNGETNLEKYVRNALNDIGIEFIQEARIGRYSIDFYFPGYWIALEVDGNYWHKDVKRDNRKDKYLTKNGIKVVRINELEIYQIGACDAINKHLTNYLNLNPPAP